MALKTKQIAGITHDVHVRREDGEIAKFEGVLDVMKMPTGKLKFTHSGNLKEFSNAEVIRCRVHGVEDAHKYVCPECESDEAVLVSSVDRGDTLHIPCTNCGAERLERREM